ncbi:unnamed protein product [Sphagnum troendelagicum]|uniref:Uncharacterized protein n=1 Tax=Sphagnum troendelagicum TaxID=128251 RepID=A0ABP0UEN2_9BRYO
MQPMKSKVSHGEDMCSKQSAGLPIVWNATVPNQWRHGESPSQPQGQESGAPENCTQAKETLRFPVSFQKLLTWFHAREKVTFKRVPNVALQESTSMAIENALLVDQEMEKEKFLACLWHVGSRPADALSKKKETAHNIECLQRLLKVLAQYTDSSHMRSLLRVAPEGMIVKHRDACMQAFLSPPKYQHEVQVLCRTSRFEMRGVGKNFDQHCADSWLSDDCWAGYGRNWSIRIADTSYTKLKTRGHESRWVVMFMHRTGAKWLFPPYQGILNKSITAVFYPSMSKDGPQVQCFPQFCILNRHNEMTYQHNPHLTGYGVWIPVRPCWLAGNAHNNPFGTPMW